jgi:hydroxyacylglutathione hydrolase
MGAFMATLARLAARDDRLYLPGHGPPVEEPARVLAELTAHRQARAGQIREAIARGPATPEALAAGIYTDLDARLMPAAMRNVLATLIWLTERGEVAPEGPHGPATAYRPA